ncbi:tetratricopeptide repeat protein [Parapedobacter indicus]|uniref:Tetratricopeptide repeat-containing protein n=1 Tax=Parapedobacter indicus TaxID=1477437 RepID=A0A1I3IQ34_9SPHI|nr:tetratricopeptide repeat protein [Parapedobacter indicus]PPL02252.1 hypothetical protein CLV26_104177 [Parapedobacter indicus]SFI50066.1 Tetratricopeptide repeat-containing protein [Parapedobacter indicus]
MTNDPVKVNGTRKPNHPLLVSNSEIKALRSAMAKQKIARKTRMDEARQLEKEGKSADALKIYRALVRRKPLNADAYSRMMVILRKQKKYEAELETIQQAIATAEKAIASNQQAFDDKDRDSAALSRKLAKSLGLLNDEGLPVYEEPQLRAWRKREAVVEKRLESRR